MSVNNTYLAVDWQRFLEMAQQPDVEKRMGYALENEEPWLRDFPFGNQVDEYLFESRKALREFDEWFREARKPGPPLCDANARPKEPIGPDTDLLSLAAEKLRGVLGGLFRFRRASSSRFKAIEAFHKLFLDFGLTHDDETIALKPINRLSGPSRAWLVAAMSPEDVQRLRNRAAAINRRELAEWFDAALASKPCTLVEDGSAAIAWLEALNAGLDNTAAKCEGIVLGIA